MTTYAGLTLEEIEALVSRATPGPWTTERPDRASERWAQGMMIVAAVAPGQGVYANPPGGSYPESDRKLIASLRNAAPTLIARIRKLEEMLDRVIDEASHFSDRSDGTQSLELRTLWRDARALKGGRHAG